VSGIAGIFERDDKPIDRELLRALTDFLSGRGPDALETWSEGSVGFGHAMLRTTRESRNERQPVCLDGRFWITADARIDCRADLVAKLRDSKYEIPTDIADSELILRAFGKWGEDCVQYLRGDFAFAIWDTIRRELFCARDHLGVKPFYYAEVAEAFIFSNTLNCVRLHPGISDELNDDAILDFLIVGLNCDNGATSFRAVRRLPPAHSISVAAGGVRLRCYWSVPIGGRIRYRRDEDYLHHFHSLFQAAVKDRIRTDRVGVALSGGLDSGSIAAEAKQLGRSDPGAFSIHAHTVAYDHLFHDQEGYFARKTADFLGIPIRVLTFDNLMPFQRWQDPETALPAPVGDPYFAETFEEFESLGSQYRVLLNGHGGDDVMDFQMWPYIQDLARRREWRRLIMDGSNFLRVRRFPWRGLFRRALGIMGRGPLAPLAPEWILARWGSPAELRNRWRQRTTHPGADLHPVLPRAHANLSQPQWTFLFELSDPAVTRACVEVRFPFLDLRLIEYLLALPPFPWFFRKNLIRRAMNGRLPESVLRRPKTPLAADPLVVRLNRGESLTRGDFAWSDEVTRYIDLSKWAPPRGDMPVDRVRMDTRPLCLNFWLRWMRPVRV
jgi:asparagine synthase (glutamine-hydrolysing)